MGVNVYALGPQKMKMWSSVLPDQHSFTVPPTGTSSAQPFLKIQRHNLWHSPPLIALNIKRDQQPFSLSFFNAAAYMLCKEGLCKRLPSPPPVVIDKWEQEYVHQMVSGSVGEVEGHMHHGLPLL